MKMRMFFILFLSGIFSACAYKPELKTEVDQASGTTTVSTQEFTMGGKDHNPSVYGRASEQATLGFQVKRIENTEAKKPTKYYEIKISADGQSPRLKIQKENSLVLLVDNEELKFSPAKTQANENEVLADYFPAFRTEVATFSNIRESDLSKWVASNTPRIRIIGESRQEEVKLTEEIQMAVKALLPATTP